MTAEINFIDLILEASLLVQLVMLTLVHVGGILGDDYQS
ncbi:motA/tolQ/exbB proton channel family protein [Vibrio sp. JCM 19236]|nr:motA/tolQ/exbB proton channel family protein [Vibrio sp. JCM 19236]